MKKHMNANAYILIGRSGYKGPRGTLGEPYEVLRFANDKKKKKKKKKAYMQFKH